MSKLHPDTKLDRRFSSHDASPTAWSEADRVLDQAGIFWLTTVRPDGRPHVTPLIAVWLDNAMHFCTGVDERKWKNLAGNDHCILTTGSNAYQSGLDIVVEGNAVRVTDDDVLRAIAEAFEAKYGADWHFDVKDGAFQGQGEGGAWVYRVDPVTAFGFGRGEQPSQTRWRFGT
jgi:hypothetical protein